MEPGSVQLQELLDCPLRGGEWDVPLRLIARCSLAVDVYAPRMQRLNKQCKYAWELASAKNEIDLRAWNDICMKHLRNSNNMKDLPRNLVWQNLHTHKLRKIEMQRFLMRGFELDHVVDGQQVLGLSEEERATQGRVVPAPGSFADALRRGGAVTRRLIRR